MPKKTSEAEEVVETIETTEATPDSEAKTAFAALIESYKTQNPAKYELKKEELEKQLNSL